jgi:DNA-directed RNA polymerase subunit RPC12/RpoP
MIRFRCSSCSKLLKVTGGKGGAKVACPKCGHKMLVPQPPGAAAPPADTSVKANLPALFRPPVQEPHPEPPPVEDVTVVYPVPRRRKRFGETDCWACGRLLRFRWRDQGRVLRCPSCLYYYRAPGDRHPGADDGLPVVVQVSAVFLSWPSCCACCLDLPDTRAGASHTRIDWGEFTAGINATSYDPVYGALRMLGSAEDRGWSVPYCWECLDHIRRRPDRSKRDCCGLDAAVEYDGWHGTVHQFRFYNWQYANRFIHANQDKCLT